MFDFACILIALFIYYKTDNKNNNISFVLMSWFVISDLSYTYLFTEFRQLEHWLIYQIYNSINSITIYLLAKLNAHVFILIVLAMNILLNVTCSMYFVYQFIPESVYNAYYYGAVTITIWVLIYMIIIQRKAAVFGGNSSHSSIINVLCWRYADARRVFNGRSL